MWRLILRVLVLPVLVFEIAFLRGVHLTPWALLNLLLFPALLAVSIALHEAGHASVARLVGLDVPRISIGIGREVWRSRVGRTLVIVNTFPTFGITCMSSTGLEWIRLRLWIATAAGPLVTLALAKAAAWPLPSLFAWDVMFPMHAMSEHLAIGPMIAFMNIWLLLANLVPWSILIGNDKKTDGTLLLSLPFYSARQLQPILDSAATLQMLELFEANDDLGARRVLGEALEQAPGSWSLRLFLACVESELGNLTFARATCLELMQEMPLAESPPTPLQVSLARANLAWIDCLLRLPELLDEADSHSAAVFEAYPKAEWAAGTRGAVLVWLGRFGEAIPLLERAYHGSSARRARAAGACDLAAALAGLQRHEEAQRWLDRARENNCSSVRLTQAREAVEAAAIGMH